MTSAAEKLKRLTASDDYAALKKYILRRTGLSYYADRDDELVSRIETRLQALSLEGCGAYLAMLESSDTGKDEFDALVAELSIGETYFFRHREQWDALKSRVLPDIIGRNHNQKRIRIWSAACSIGAEAYTMSLLLRRETAAQIEGWQIQIVGTDINRRFLSQAYEGRFDDWALRSSDQSLREQCFERRGNQWALKTEYRSGVEFQYHNLIEDPFPSVANNLYAFDLILCRNVMIYFSPSDVGRLIRGLSETLVPNGWLVVGSADLHAEYDRHFRPETAPGAILYQKVSERERQEAKVPKRPAAPKPAAPAPAPAASPAPRSSAGSKGTREFRLGLIEPILVLTNEGRLDDAAKLCKDRMDRDKLEPRLPYYLALIEEGRGDTARAEALLRQALYLDRKFALAHYQLGFTLKRHGKPKEAKRAFKNAAQLFGELRPDSALPAGENLTAGEGLRLAQRQIELLEEDKS